MADTYAQNTATLRERDEAATFDLTKIALALYSIKLPCITTVPISCTLMASQVEEAIRTARRVDSERVLIEQEIAGLLPLLGPAGMTKPLVDGALFWRMCLPHPHVHYGMQRRVTLALTLISTLYEPHDKKSRCFKMT